MSVESGVYTNVTKRAAELGCAVPTGITLLPRNFETATSREDLVHDSAGLSVRAAWRSAGVDETRLEPPSERWPALQKDAAEWLGPVIFIGSALWSTNPAAVDIALGVIANYVTEYFRGTPREQRQARLSIVIETDSSGETRKLDYEGTPEGIAELPQVIEEMRR